MPLVDKIDLILDELSKRRKFIAHNHKAFDIFQGNLLPYVEEVMRTSLSPSYYGRIQHRIYPVNILRKLVTKLAKVYSTDPMRRVPDGQNKDILDFYEKSQNFNKIMNTADEFNQLFKGYAFKPILRTDARGNTVPGAKVLPFDRFLPIGEDLRDPLKVTIFCEIMGNISKRGKNGDNKKVQVLFCFSDDEFIVIDSDGDRLPEFEEGTNGINAAGFIPYYYGNRDDYEMIPTLDTDLLQTSILFPVLYSDLGGAIFFQCFSIMWGIDVNFENLDMAPNNFWSLKSDPASDKKPEIGFVKPQADVEKVLSYIRELFKTWIESRNVKVGSIGSVNASNMASGISKIVDELDTFEIVKKSQQTFKVDELNIWELNRKMHNYWISTGELRNLPILPESWIVETEYDDPRPLTDRGDDLNNTFLEVEKGTMSLLTATKTLHPDWDDDRIKEEQSQISLEENGGIDIGMDQNRDQSAEESRTIRT